MATVNSAAPARAARLEWSDRNLIHSPWHAATKLASRLGRIAGAGPTSGHSDHGRGDPPAYSTLSRVSSMNASSNDARTGVNS